MAKNQKTDCPCSSGIEYSSCCGRFIESNEIPETPEQLMRSRYTAYVRKDDSYILDTWHTSTRPASLSDENNLPVKWVELKVINSRKPVENQTTGTVEFIARCKINGKAEKMHEVSEFIKEQGRWYYLQGKTD